MKRVYIWAIGCWLVGCGSPEPDVRQTTEKRVVVLGFDGVDPDLVHLWMNELPNIQRLAAEGTFCTLGTTNPPESPVAWASWATGLNPGKHGIFDFLKRDPATYRPSIGLVKVEKAKFLWGLIPIRPARIESQRRGVPFWKYLDAHGISSINLRIPLEFPAQALEHGKTWSGLGVPDMRGTWGTYFYFATDLSQWELRDTEFGGRLERLEFGPDGKARVELDGPIDPRADEYRRLSLPLEFELSGPDGGAVTIRAQGQEQTLRAGQWSDWFRFTFSMGPLVSLAGISRFYALETSPEVRLYLMPISFDPSDSPAPLSAPKGFTADLVDKLGLFKTVGWIHETWGLNEERIDEGIFLDDLFRNMSDLEAALLAAMDTYNASLYTAVFTGTDSASHMFFRLLDTAHPMYDSALAARYGDAVLRVYKKMDEILGAVLGRLRADDYLIVVSDHGFHSWRREFNTNTWLKENGYLSLNQQDPGDFKRMDDMFKGGSFFPNVDWSRTRAYALGLSHVFVNLRGRESQGIVEPGAECNRLLREIRDKLLAFRDPDTGEPVLQGVYLPNEIYKGDQVAEAGDLQLTFRSGYRTSWQTSLGAIPDQIVTANLRKWSGDHCSSDHSDTGGFLLCNKPIRDETPTILDVAPTLYDLFGVEIPRDVDGRPWIWLNSTQP
jgi:predicted AlkP superfamily phosphohydrolase/phosphomutase